MATLIKRLQALDSAGSEHEIDGIIDTLGYELHDFTQTELETSEFQAFMQAEAGKQYSDAIYYLVLYISSNPSDEIGNVYVENAFEYVQEWLDFDHEKTIVARDLFGNRAEQAVKQLYNRLNTYPKLGDLEGVSKSDVSKLGISEEEVLEAGNFVDFINHCLQNVTVDDEGHYTIIAKETDNPYFVEVSLVANVESNNPRDQEIIIGNVAYFGSGENAAWDSKDEENTPVIGIKNYRALLHISPLDNLQQYARDEEYVTLADILVFQIHNS